MDFLKELFGEGALSFDQFVQAVTAKGWKLADLSTGNYVSKRKYDDEIAAKNTAIDDLNGQIKTRDGDIKDLQQKLTDAGNDATKLAEVTTQLEKLQGDYNNAKKDFDTKLQKQSYEFAVREFASTQTFTSNAAKKQFISDMISENLKMKDNTILGADDFMKVYKEQNADSFVTQPEGAGNETNPTPNPADNKPTFTAPPTPTPGGAPNPFANAFNFVGVRPHTDAQK